MSKKADKVVFLIDRVELGDQSYTDYTNFANVDDSINDTSDTDALIKLLKSDEANEKVIITSIQKMSRIKEGDVPQSVINKIRGKRIVFIVDECHRDQNGEMHQNIEHTFPTAMFFGYTGTPDHALTKDIFGSEKHRYTIAHGIRDRNVLGFDPYEVHIFDDNDLRQKVGLNLVHAATEAEAMTDDMKRDKYLYYLNQGIVPCPMTEIEKHIPVTQYQTDNYRRKVVENILKRWTVRSYNSLFHAIFATSSIPEAIEYSKENARFNGLDNTLFFAGDMKDILTAEFVGKYGRPDVIITDPPRAGMHTDVIKTILLAAPRRIVYVSCNSATQARDLALLDADYRVTAVQPVDMFPQTHHVENVVRLDRRN